jgi:molybdopterin-binding protein
MKSTACLLLATFVLACSVPAAAQLQVGAGDTVESVLRAQKDKRVTLRLRSGQELTGMLKASNARVAHLAAITGREFFDAVVPLEAIDAVLIRTKE